MSRVTLEAVIQWALANGFSAGHADTLPDLLGELSEQVKGLRDAWEVAASRADAARVHLASIRSLCEVGWPRGMPCRLCGQVRKHSDVCYVVDSTGYDLLEEHAATLHENAELRAALAARLPTNGKHIMSGDKYVSLRARVRGHGRFSRHED